MTRVRSLRAIKGQPISAGLILLTLPASTALQRPSVRHAVIVFMTVFFLFSTFLLFPQAATAQSKRCPSDQIKIEPGDILTSVEGSTIETIWKDLHGAGASGGDGPLGCPVGKAQNVDDARQTWKGVKQNFQRGWIGIGRGSSAGSEIAVIRGWNNWTIWMKGISLTNVFPVMRGQANDWLKQREFSTATWSRGGNLLITEPTPVEVSLVQCPTDRPYERVDPNDFAGNLIPVTPNESSCIQLTPFPEDPDRLFPDRPFDAAAHLDEHLLTTPSAEDSRWRINALFADWLPCYTMVPEDIGTNEDDIARAHVMLRGSDSLCPLTGKRPSEYVKQALLKLKFPSDMLPGTSSGDTSCPRKGELDVTLVQLLNLALTYKEILDGFVFEHIKSVLDPWGVAARSNPYITFDANNTNLCYGYAIIETENHMLLQETAAYLINSLMGRNTASNRDWLLKFLSQIVRRDFYEFNALPYSRYQLKALYALHDHAPDDSVRLVAEGVLDWLFAKQAFSGNLDRDHRPYRRLHDVGQLNSPDWWGVAGNPITTATALLVGPLQHAHADIDLQFNNGLDEASIPALTEVTLYPKLGTVSSYSAAALVDTMSTAYQLPTALIGWLEWRFTREESNRTTYLQAINHVTKNPEDLAIFRQSNSGAELISGNRNWTMIGGGTPAPYGDPGPPPFWVSTWPWNIVGGIGRAYANKKQREHLSDSQTATIRETTLIPTSIGLDRTQTIRFGRPRLGTDGVDRVCVAEGFMCGYDLIPPVRQFSTKDSLTCPVNVEIPSTLINAFQIWVGLNQTITSVLGCPKKNVGYSTEGNWNVWTFDNGMLALGNDTKGQERFAGSWIEGRTDKDRGRLRVAWNIRGDGYDWFRVHAYKRSVDPTGGEPPGGWIEPLPVVGDAGDRTKEAAGETTFPIPDVLDPDLAQLSWDVLIVGCKKQYFLGVLTGHDCVDNKMPRLTVNVGPLPKQSFSCAVHRAGQIDKAFGLKPEGIVMEVGSCNGGPYGMFVYVWNQPCPHFSFKREQQCPEGAIDYGFVVAAPSRGMKPDEFRIIITESLNLWRQTGNTYDLDFIASVAVPISPPVVRGPNGWMPSAPPSWHTVKFNWPRVGSAAILDDSGAPGLFVPAKLGAAPKDWPAALGHVSAPDSIGASDTLMHNPGNGCFTVAGFPTPSNLNPIGLLVDFRNLSAPIVADHLTSELASLCL